MKRKAIVLAAVLSIGAMSLAACSTDGKNNNSATDDRAGTSSTAPTSSVSPTSSGDVLDDIGNDVKDGADDIGNDVKDGAGDVEKGAKDIGDDVEKGVDDLTGKDKSSESATPAMPTNNANDMVTSSPK